MHFFFRSVSNLFPIKFISKKRPEYNYLKKKKKKIGDVSQYKKEFRKIVKEMCI